MAYDKFLTMHDRTQMCNYQPVPSFHKKEKLKVKAKYQNTQLNYLKKWKDACNIYLALIYVYFLATTFGLSGELSTQHLENRI